MWPDRIGICNPPTFLFILPCGLVNPRQSMWNDSRHGATYQNSVTYLQRFSFTQRFTFSRSIDERDCAFNRLILRETIRWQLFTCILRYCRLKRQFFNHEWSGFKKRNIRRNWKKKARHARRLKLQFSSLSLRGNETLPKDDRTFTCVWIFNFVRL